MRRQAETAWFQSFLTFEPARVMRDVEQPILIVHGLLDTQVLPEHADRLLAMAQARDEGTVEIARLPRINHLLASAATGEPDEYGTLADKRVSTDVTDSLSGWLEKALAPDTR
jgi:dipeptidyl aminopeptidase/acylaminoacyl peptidase